MGRRLFAAISALLLAVSPAFAHGGGGYVYVPVFIMRKVQSVVPSVQTGDYSHIHNIAIISALGGELKLHDSLVWSGPDQPPVDISSWKIDAQVENELVRFLSGRFTIEKVNYDRAEIEGIENGKGASSDEALRDKLRAISSDGIDAFVVVRPDVEGGMLGPPGLGVENRSGERPVAWANYEIDIIDAHTLKMIGHAASRLQSRSGGVIGFPGRYRRDGFVVDGKSTPTPEQLAQMQTLYAPLISATMLTTLRSLNLGVMLPQAGERQLIPIPQPMKPFGKAKTVAVISAIGDDLEIDHRGKFFEHSQKTVSIADWNLNSEIEAKIAASLDKQFTVKTVPADRTKLSKLVPATTGETLATPIDGLTRDSGVDLYIVVLKNKNSCIGLDEVHGLTLCNQTPFGDEVSWVFVSYSIVIVDPHTLTPILIRTGIMSPDFSLPAPNRLIDNAIFPKDWATLLPDQAKIAHQVITNILDDSLPETLLSTSLTGEMPAPPPDSVASTPVASTSANGGSPSSPIPSSQTPTP